MFCRHGWMYLCILHGAGRKLTSFGIALLVRYFRRQATMAAISDLINSSRWP